MAVRTLHFSVLVLLLSPVFGFESTSAQSLTAQERKIIHSALFPIIQSSNLEHGLVEADEEAERVAIDFDIDTLFDEVKEIINPTPGKKIDPDDIKPADALFEALDRWDIPSLKDFETKAREAGVEVSNELRSAMSKIYVLIPNGPAAPSSDRPSPAADPLRRTDFSAFIAKMLRDSESAATGAEKTSKAQPSKAGPKLPTSSTKAAPAPAKPLDWGDFESVREFFNTHPHDVIAAAKKSLPVIIEKMSVFTAEQWAQLIEAHPLEMGFFLGSNEMHNPRLILKTKLSAILLAARNRSAQKLLELKSGLDSDHDPKAGVLIPLIDKLCANALATVGKTKLPARASKPEVPPAKARAKKKERP